MQLGSVREVHGSWWLRYYVDVLVNGVKVRHRKMVKLGRVDEMSEKDAQAKAQERMGLIRGGPSHAGGSLTVGEYIEKYFLPYVEDKKRSNTLRFYRQMLRCHVIPKVGDIEMRDFEPVHAQRVLDGQGRPLTQTTLLRIKSSMSAVFSHAVRCGILKVNPVREARAEGRRTKPDTYAYSLDEIEYMMDKLAEPARTIVATAALAGLRHEELRGLQWEDYDGQELQIRRVLWGWRQQPEDPKTEESANPVPVIPQLRRILDAHRKRNGHSIWMFPGPRKGRPMNLENYAARIIKPLIGDRWHGWHAFRRGLVTTLWGYNVPVEQAQAILRHADVSITREHYLRLDASKESKAAMKKLSKRLGHGWGKAKKATA